MGAGVGEGAGESLGEEEIPKTSSSATAAPKALNSQTLIGEWLDSREKRPPRDVIGQASSIVKRLLEVDKIAYEDVRNGLIAWDRKRMHPSTIPSFVNEAMDDRNSKPLTGARGHVVTAEQLASGEAEIRL